MRRQIAIISLILAASLILSACGGTQAAAAPSAAPTASSAAASGAPSAESGYTFRTTAEKRVANENGSFTAADIVSPVLVTSIGQSADVSMLDALMKKIGADYTFKATASAEEVASAKTVIIACGASSKGLGAAGISQEDEIARAEAIVKTIKDNGIVAIVAHLGGAARRGALSDKFNDMALSCSSYILVVEEGNNDGKFTDAATERSIPITLIYSIADAMTPLKELFGQK